MSLESSQVPAAAAGTLCERPDARQPDPEEYDEEAALAAALAESLRTSHPASRAADAPTGNKEQPPSFPTMAISPIERENIQLFSELMRRMQPHDRDLEDPQFMELARDMAGLKDRLYRALSSEEYYEAGKGAGRRERVLPCRSAAAVERPRVGAAEARAAHGPRAAVEAAAPCARVRGAKPRDGAVEAAEPDGLDNVHCRPDPAWIGRHRLLRGRVLRH